MLSLTSKEYKTIVANMCEGATPTPITTSSLKGFVLLNLRKNKAHDNAYELSIKITLPDSKQFSAGYPRYADYEHTLPTGAVELWHVIAFKRENFSSGGNRDFEGQFEMPKPSKANNYTKIHVIHFEGDQATFEVKGEGIVRYADATEIGGGGGT